MASHVVCFLFLTLTWSSYFCLAQYTIPEVQFEAFTPRGLRISIPEEEGLELFGFHGNLNKPIRQIEPGEISEDVTRSTNGRFVFFNPDLVLKEGDAIYYWVFVQHNLLGYRRDGLVWKVEKLLEVHDKSRLENCKYSITKVKGKESPCSGADIINYNFIDSVIDQKIWTIEQYIPQEPDWEYVIYKNDPDVISVENNVLRIKPKVVPENLDRDIKIDSCTRQDIPKACVRIFEGLYHPPIVSGQIVSKDAFSFGEIHIKAKIPQGDWVYPEIYLEAVDDPKRRILIAFARGNRALTDDNGNEIGGKLLYAGPYNVQEPNARNQYLAKMLFDDHVGESWHIFTVKWTRDRMDLMIDLIDYGSIGADALRATGFNEERMVRLVLGVGVGSLYAFPEPSTAKLTPWKFTSRSSMKDFLMARDKWQPSWNADNQLLVESVTIKAL